MLPPCPTDCPLEEQREQRQERASRQGEEEIRKKGRHGSPLKRNKFCRGEARGPSPSLCKSLCFRGGMRREAGDGLALITRVISPTYVHLNFQMLHQRAASSWKPLGLLAFIYCCHSYSKIRAAVT